MSMKINENALDALYINHEKTIRKRMKADYAADIPMGGIAR